MPGFEQLNIPVIASKTERRRVAIQEWQGIVHYLTGLLRFARNDKCDEAGKTQSQALRPHCHCEGVKRPWQSRKAARFTIYWIASLRSQ